jgi:catechol 2,3-dioxygenase-like lactoylglutathione lyase family enzyme
VKLDHIALGTHNYDARSSFFLDTLGLTLLRTGVRYTTGTRIAMIGTSEQEPKIELVEQQPDSTEREGFLHVAFRVRDVEVAFADLTAKGLKTILEPHDLPKAQARSALLEDATGLQIQIIQYYADLF